MSRSVTCLAAASLLALVLAVGCTPEGGDQPPRDSPVVVSTSGGDVRGAAAQGARGFLGIPYAAPPVGDLRWAAPQDAEPWSDVRDATSPGSPCLQPAPGGGVVAGSSEDCLYLNVFRPDSDARELPVLVYIHGGGFTQGHGQLDATAVSRTVKRGLVLVSLNYRLGRLGFLAHPALEEQARAEGKDPVANFGLLDQIAALRWVQQNIEAFGGDPARVTIHGMSAGAASVNYLMSSPEARGLFHGAISQSGLGSEHPQPYAEAADDGRAVAGRLGAPDADLEELRVLPGESVAQAPAQILRDQIPVQDAVLPGPVTEVFAGGREADVPYLVGTSERELPDGGLAVLGLDPPRLRAQLLAGSEAEAVATYGDRGEMERQLLTDMLFTEPARQLARDHAQRAPTYRYRFAVASEAARAQHGGAIHGSDLLFAFGTTVGDVPNGADLAEQFGECVATFVEQGAPDCGVDWPRAETGGLVEFTNDGPRVHQSDPWDDRLDLVARLSGG